MLSQVYRSSIWVEQKKIEIERESSSQIYPAYELGIQTRSWEVVRKMIKKNNLEIFGILALLNIRGRHPN